MDTHQDGTAVGGRRFQNKRNRMHELSLQSQTIRLTREINGQVSALKTDDPIKAWFSIELQQLGVDERDEKLPLDQANSRLCALRQLLHLIIQHRIRLENHGREPSVSECESNLTVEARIPFNVLNSASELRFSIEPSLLHELRPENEQFDPVSPTARIVGCLRGLDRSLKITNSLCQATAGEALMEELGITDPKTKASMAVLFQSRYHALNAAIAETQEVNQIIEFASGISPRGFQWSQMSPGTIYVESDLPQLMIHKAKLLRDSLLDRRGGGRGLLHCCAVNVLDRESVSNSLNSLDTTKPFTIVTEGLLLYFNVQEMEQFLSNMHSVLSRFPQSTWVTDIVSRQNLEELLACDPSVAESVRKVFALTGREVVPANPFQSDECILRRIHQFGMRLESTIPLRGMTKQLEFGSTLSQKDRNGIVGSRKTWRLSAK